MPSATDKSVASPYHVGGDDGIIVGHPVVETNTTFVDDVQIMKALTPELEKESTSDSESRAVQPREWHLPSGVYRARQIVVALSPLINSVTTRLGPDPPGEPSAHDVLLDGVLSSLSINTREATFPLSPSVTDLSRREIAQQAVRIGETLVQWAREIPVIPTKLQFRSHCDGHIWTIASGLLLRGIRSDNQQMQLYNEYQNQMVLLRDALLPFHNFEEVVLVIDESGSARGLRAFEPLRDRFMLQCLTKKVTQNAIVDVAKAFTAPKLPLGGYGVQYSEGLILPAYLSGCSSLHLLQYHPARLDDSVTDLLFVYEHEDYYSAPRTEISKPIGIIPQDVWPPTSSKAPSHRVVNPSLVLSSYSTKYQPERFLKLELELDDDVVVTIDIGQITRGRRYAYHVHDLPAQLAATSLHTKTGLSKTSFLHSAAEVLRQPGLVTSEQTGCHVIPATDPIIRLALLGKLYPENVVTLSAKQAPRSAEKVGKGYGPRFIVYGGECEDNQKII